MLSKHLSTVKWGKGISVDWALRIRPSLHASVLSRFSHCPTLRDPMDSSQPDPLSTGFSRQEYRRGLPFPSPGHLPNPEIKYVSPVSTDGFFTTEPPGKPHVTDNLPVKTSLMWVDIKHSLKKWQPTPVLLPGEFHGQRSRADYSPWDCKESDMTEWLTFTFTFYIH